MKKEGDVIELGNAKASLLDGPRGNFIIGEYTIPNPRPGGILMKIELCGICGTDVHTWQAEDIGMEYPISLGHEIVGKVAALGEGVIADYVGNPLKTGDRIGVIPAIHCHRCYFCAIAKTPENALTGKLMVRGRRQIRNHILQAVMASTSTYMTRTL